MKLCKDCKHYEPDYSAGFIHVAAMCCAVINPIYGGSGATCSYNRSRDGDCGLDGKQWEEAPFKPVEAKPSWWKFW